MTNIITIRDQNEIKLNNKWSLDSQEKFVKVEGRDHKVIRYRKPFSTCEKVMRIFLGLLAVLSSFCLALISPRVLDLFRKKNQERQYAIPMNSNSATTQNPKKTSTTNPVTPNLPPKGKELIDKITKNILGNDQNGLTKELYSYYENTAEPPPVFSLLKQYSENQQFDKLDMIIKALKHIISEEKRLYSVESPWLDEIIKPYKDIYTEEQANRTVTPKKILLEGLSDNVRYRQNILRYAETIINSLKNDARNPEFDNAVGDYINARNDVEPLLNLAQFYIDNEPLKALRIITILKDLQVHTILNQEKASKYFDKLQSIEKQFKM